VLLTALGWSGVGDAPDPHDPPASVVAHFRDVHDDVLLGAALGVVGAVLVGAFLLGLALRLQRGGAPAAAVGVGAGAVLVVTYLAGLHAVYTSLAVLVADTSPEAAKALFVLTIMVTPAVGAAVAVVLGAAATGAHRLGPLPAWWVVLTALGAGTAAVAVGSYAESGWFYPDVQQQVVGNVLLVWAAVTSVLLAVRARAAAREGPG
jgi:hypothetical protein